MSNEDAPRQTTMCPRYKAQINGDVTGKTNLPLSAHLTLLTDTGNMCIKINKSLHKPFTTISNNVTDKNFLLLLTSNVTSAIFFSKSTLPHSFIHCFLISGHLVMHYCLLNTNLVTDNPTYTTVQKKEK